MSQFTSRLCLTSQLYLKNIFMLFKSITAVSICFLCLFISTSSSAYHVTSPFLVLLALKTLNDWLIGSVLIFSLFDQLFINFSMCASRIYQYLQQQFFSILYLDVCLYIQLSFSVVSSIWNNILILSIKYRDSLYCAYLEPSPKSFCLLPLSSDSS